MKVDRTHGLMRNRRGLTLSLRLLTLLLMIVLVAIVAFTTILNAAIERERLQQLRDARRHFEARMVALDQDWRNSAFSIARQAELWMAGAEQASAEMRDARLRTLLVTIMDQSDFTHAVIRDVDGQAVFRYGSRAQGEPEPVSQAGGRPAAWAWSSSDHLVYRIVDGGSLRFGNRSVRLQLLVPLDNALLSRLVYPRTMLSLLHEGRSVSASREIAEKASDAVEFGAEMALRWDASPGAPSLRISRRFASPLSTTQLFVTIGVCACLLIAGTWLVLVRWVRSQTRRLYALQQGATDFAGTAASERLPDELVQRLQRAAKPQDDIGILADRLLGMMQRMAQYQTEQAAAHAMLSEMNAQLEARVVDRTAQLEAVNQTLAERDRFVQTVTDCMPAMVSHWDADLRCRFANAAYLDWLGRPADQVIGRAMSDLLSEALFKLDEPHARAALRGERQAFQRSQVRPDGGTEHTLAVFAPELVAGQVRGFNVVISDVTEIKLAELQLSALNEALAERAEQAEAATRAKSAFLSNMSHEIRTPMNAIIGLTYLLSRDTMDSLQRDRLGKIEVAARHLLQVINDILDLSKIESGKAVLDVVEFSVDELMVRAFEMVSGTARDKGLELVLDTDHLPDRLCGDPTRLSQALINLLGNAVKFTPSGWVRLRCDQLSEDAKGVLVRFEVQDTGEGIAPESQAQLFQAFEQADASTTRRHGGTGLGLALTRHLATMMGGEVGLRSAPGEGSTFWFTARLSRASEAGELAAPIPLAGLRALLVDDLPEALAALKDRLEMMGLQVDAQSSGQTALARVSAEMAAGRPYDVMLIDWRMPPPDGITLLHSLRQMLGDGMPPAILVTAFDETVMWEEARGAHCSAVLVKPITASALHDALARVLRRNRGAVVVDNAPSGQTMARLKQGHAGQRVLLAEDNPINQEVAVDLLRSAGLVVDTAENGVRALAMVAATPYDLVLMDVQMPEMDGLDATRALRQRLGRGLPVVAMTANAFGEDRAACLQAGMNDHIGKPVDPETLFATLLRWLPVRDKPAAAAGRGAERQEPAPSLEARLLAVPGFDVAAALKMANGQWATLGRLLDRFTSLYREGVPTFLQAIDTPDAAPAWRAVCHSLRGACASVGCVELAHELHAFEQALATSTDLNALALQGRQIHEELCRLVGDLTQALQG